MHPLKTNRVWCAALGGPDPETCGQCWQSKADRHLTLTHTHTCIPATITPLPPSITMASPAVVVSATAVSAPPTADTTKQRVRLIHPATVAKHNSESSLWVVYKVSGFVVSSLTSARLTSKRPQNRVFDVTEFAPDHPGGDELILEYAGKDMGDIMEDPLEHSHSDSAFELLEEYFVGRLAMTAAEKALCGESSGNPAYILPANEGVVIDADYEPTDTDASNDYKKYQFLDLSKPLLVQVWNAKFSKEFYMRQVHSPRHLKESARLFGPSYLEMFTRTPWYIVPLVWLPISFALYARSAYQFSQAGQIASFVESTPTSAALVNATQPLGVQADLFSHTAHATAALSSISATSLGMTLPCFLFGIFVWTILEYTMHRFLFHIDDWLPDRPFFLMLHFLLHGIHHYLPMDRLRLVMPPILFMALSYPFTQLAHALFPAAIANGIISGAFFMYVGYDCTHYFLHHHRLPDYVKRLKATHLRHHFSDPDRYFGVTSRFWDVVFGTDK